MEKGNLQKNIHLKKNKNMFIFMVLHFFNFFQLFIKIYNILKNIKNAIPTRYVLKNNILFYIYSPLTSNSPAPILEQTWVTRSEAPTTNAPVPIAPQKDYTALSISHSAPASHQTSFERGESVERTRPHAPSTTSSNNNNRYTNILSFLT